MKIKINIPISKELNDSLLVQLEKNKEISDYRIDFEKIILPESDIKNLRNFLKENFPILYLLINNMLDGK